MIDPGDARESLEPVRPGDTVVVRDGTRVSLGGEFKPYGGEACLRCWSSGGFCETWDFDFSFFSSCSMTAAYRRSISISFLALWSEITLSSAVYTLL